MTGAHFRHGTAKLDSIKEEQQLQEERRRLENRVALRGQERARG